MDDGRDLVSWLGGRGELWPTDAMREHSRLDPWRSEHARFFERVRELDTSGWCAPLGRARPSWVFYDCVLVPGALFGFARRERDELVPVSVLALIPTLFDHQLVQTLAVRDDLADPEELAHRTLREGSRALAATRLVAALPWRSPFLARFLALGPLRLHTAITPAHDEEETLTFSVEVTPAARSPLAPPRTLDARDRDALAALQTDLERGESITLTAMHPTGASFTLSRGPG